MGKKRSIQINQENKLTKYFQSMQGTKLGTKNHWFSFDFFFGGVTYP